MTSLMMTSLCAYVGPLVPPPPPVLTEPGVGLDVGIQSLYAFDGSSSKLTPLELEFHVASSTQAFDESYNVIKSFEFAT
ncbi:MAG: Uncharacterised protein [Candidatus Poseidoniaceae archaeon]|nr:MAG: Uncharacterised protein [Candidatus Poseidoniaceae archaeon]